MGKDPAFLFYSSDFLTGVAGLTMEERGQYITLMCLQHQHGHLPEKTIWLSLGLRSVTEIPDVIAKFQLDENGLYYQKRLDKEIDIRSNYVDSRVVNGSKGGRPRKPDTEEEPTNNHMLNHKDNHVPNLREDEDEDEDDNEIIDKKENIPFKLIVDYLNLKLGTSYKATTEKTKDCIRARYHEKFTLENFYTVIDTKTEEWKDDEKMQKFLRPETLFGNKFEGYLNQKATTKKAGPVKNAGGGYDL